LSAVAADAVPADPVPADAVPRLAAGAVLRRDRVRDEDQLLMPERIVRLNGPGAAILRCCDGRRRVDEVVKVLEDLFGTSGIGPDVDRFLADFRARGWVTW
jgi:pyrroloquinoline quinone biosynthesis protein D